MAFKKREENGGEVDPRINMAGPVSKNRNGKTRREVVQGELTSLLRRLRPHQSDAIKQAMRILNSGETADSNTLRASALILQTYQSLLKDLNALGDDEPNETVESLKEAPKFSLTMIKGKDE